jgi:hypothetical protein
MTIHLTRDSVAMGDDIDAPHAYALSVPIGCTLAQALQYVLNRPYLASIAGGKATWVALLQQKPMAVLAQQWPQPALLGPDYMLPSDTEVALHFRYYTQQQPEAVVAKMRHRVA